MTDRSDDYEIGYGKPPPQSRWVKGQSGNPKGRARGKRGVKADLAHAIDGQQTVTIRGEEVTGSRQSLMFLMLATRAAAGDLKAANILVPLTMQIFGLEDRGQAKATLSPRDAALFHELVYGAPPEGGPVFEGNPAGGSPDDAGSADTSEMDA
jgi:hypothetical protein